MSRIVFQFATIALSVLAVSTIQSFAESTPEKAPDFALPRWQTSETVRLTDFAGEIVVVDVFAYWCAPCRKASSEIEDGVRKYYAAGGGNAYGIPVRVLSVNIEKSNPQRTTQYINETGADLVVNDFDGQLLERLGGAATPFIAIIDGSRATRDNPDFQVLYKHEGFEGTKTLRQMIDTVGASHNASRAGGSTAQSVSEPATGTPVTSRPELSFEAMLASDIQLTSTFVAYRQQQGGTEWWVNYTHQTMGEDYKPYAPFDFLGFAERIRTDYNGGSVFLRQQLNRSLSGSVNGGIYDGFTDYRSFWLANYYRQQFHFVPGYDSPHPRGFNVSTALRWEYQPATGFVEASFLYANDEIAPGYEFDPLAGELIRGRTFLQTYSPLLMFENILTPRLRTQNDFQLTLTTDHEPRLAYRGAVNAALGERWTWRTSGGYTRENPELRAWFLGTTLELEFAPRWFVNVFGLYYHDTGEIENSTVISTAAPGLETWRGGMGLRYVGSAVAFSLSIAPTWTDYQPVAVGTRPFTNLYRDRDWLSLQAAVTVTF